MRVFRKESVPAPRSGEIELPARVDLEIGCGTGWHPVRYAIDNPERHLVAIEQTREKFERFLGRYQGNGCPVNLSPVHDDAIAWVTHRLRSQIGRCFLLYPNPEWKRKKQRWSARPFMGYLRESFAPGGEFVFATNLPDYAESFEKEMEMHWAFRCTTRKQLSDPAHARTHFEKKYLLSGQQCHELHFVAD